MSVVGLIAFAVVVAGFDEIRGSADRRSEAQREVERARREAERAHVAALARIEALLDAGAYEEGRLLARSTGLEEELLLEPDFAALYGCDQQYEIPVYFGYAGWEAHVTGDTRWPIAELGAEGAIEARMKRLCCRNPLERSQPAYVTEPIGPDSACQVRLSSTGSTVLVEQYFPFRGEVQHRSYEIHDGCGSFPCPAPGYETCHEDRYREGGYPDVPVGTCPYWD